MPFTYLKYTIPTLLVELKTSLCNTILSFKTLVFFFFFQKNPAMYSKCHFIIVTVFRQQYTFLPINLPKINILYSV